MTPVSSAARRRTAEIFRRLDYSALAGIYCDEGGETFWRAKRQPCRRLGLAVAAALKARLRRGGRSLYVGAGVAELPALVMESLDLGREVCAYSLRKEEVRLLRAACGSLPIQLEASDAGRASGRFDHLWLVSVLNDPEEFPELSRLCYGRADASRFRPEAFAKERRAVRRLADRCLRRLSWPALVTTSVEETVWIEQWCRRRGAAYRLEERTYPTAIVGDPIGFVRLGA